MSGPLLFGLRNASKTAWQAGNHTYAIGLPDGREVFVVGDRLLVADGAVQVWTDTEAVESNQVENHRYATRWQPLVAPFCSFALPAGCWTHAYLCEALMNEPWSVDRLADPSA